MTIPSEWQAAKQVSQGEIRRRLENATLTQRRTVLEFVRNNTERINPPLEAGCLYDEMASYLLDCIVQQKETNQIEDDIDSPFEAAHELVEWFNWYMKHNNDPNAIQLKVDQVTQVFESGDDRIRNCIETGFLEHVLETPLNRPHFSHWETDPVLADSHAHALKWGLAHSKDDIK